MTVRYVLDPALTPELETGILDLWATVVNDGGAVGLLPPATADDARALWERHRVGLSAGTVRLLLGLDTAASAQRVRSMALLQRNAGALTQHWLSLYRVMVHPAAQGRGEGRRLLDEAADVARRVEEVTAIRLTCRGGLGLENFYTACGYKETGRVPGAIRLSPDDLRDEITFWKTL